MLTLPGSCCQFCLFRFWGVFRCLLQLSRKSTQIVGQRISKKISFPFLAEREEGRLNNEVRRINNEIKDLTEKRNILEVRV